MKIVISIINSDPPTLRHSKKFSKEFKQFIALCLQKDPDKRPSAEELLKHKFLQKAEDADYLKNEFLYDVKDLRDRVDSKLEALGEGNFNFSIQTTHSITSKRVYSKFDSNLSFFLTFH